jgi:hypothetical protein
MTRNISFASMGAGGDGTLSPSADCTRLMVRRDDDYDKGRKYFSCARIGSYAFI